MGDSNDAGIVTDARPLADQTVAYFVTDGEPNREYDSSLHVTNVSGTAVDQAYVDAWKRFIHDTVDNLFVVAVQTNVTDQDLLNLTNDVTTHTPGGTVEVVNVTDAGDLVHQLAETVVVGPPETVSATASLGINIGADGWGAAQISDAPTMDDGNASVHYVTGVAANGDTLIVTSDGVKLVYEDDGHGGLKAVKEGTDDVVFTVSLNTTTASYTVTMLGHVDAYTVVNGGSTIVTTDTSSSSVSGADLCRPRDRQPDLCRQ